MRTLPFLRRISLLCVLALLIGHASFAAPAAATSRFALTAEESNYLNTLRTRPIEIAYSYDLLHSELDKQDCGMLDPLLDVLKNEFGLTVNLRKLDWKEAFIQVENGEVDYYGPIALSAARKQKYITVDPFYRSYSKIVSRVNNPINSMPGLYNRKIGLLDGSIISKTMQTYLGPNGEIVYFPTMDDMINGLKNAKIDTFATVDNAEFEILLHSDIQYEFSIENFYVDQGFISGREDIRTLSLILNRYLAANPQIADEIVKTRHQTLLRRERQRLAKEIAHLQANYDEIILYADTTAYPLCYVEGGVIKGMQLEINQIFEELAGVKVRFGTNTEFPDGIASALEKIRTGECMALVGGYYDIDTWNDPSIQYSPVLWTDTIRAYSYKEVEDLHGKNVGAMPFTSDYIGWNNITGNKPIIYNSRKHLTDALKNGDIEAAFMGETAFNYGYTVLKDYSLRDMTNISAEATMHMLYGAQNKEFNSLFNETLSLFQVLYPKSMGVWKSQSGKYKADYIRMRYAQQLWLTGVGVIFFAMLLMLIYMLARNKQAHKKTAAILAEVEKKNNTIIASIDYASKIQKNLRPGETVFQKAFSDYSIIWQPKDIVGGDIYWLKTFEKGSLLCVCDCTGHGTPGALLTMLVVSALETSADENSCHDTAQIIWRLEQRLLNVLNVSPAAQTERETSALDINDGCDIAVLFVAKDGSVSVSAGNMRVFVCDGKKINKIKGQKLYIGEGRLKSKEDVKVVTVPANPDNKFYIASDGLYDQIGGKSALPFGYRVFEQIILENHNEKQAVISGKIWEAFENYRGSHLRRDDVELITFKP